MCGRKSWAAVESRYWSTTKVDAKWFIFQSARLLAESKSIYGVLLHYLNNPNSFRTMCTVHRDFSKIDKGGHFSFCNDNKATRSLEQGENICILLPLAYTSTQKLAYFLLVFLDKMKAWINQFLAMANSQILGKIVFKKVVFFSN